jgi:O-antigen ligase
MAARIRESLEEAGTFILAEGPRWMIIFLIFFAPFCYGLRDGAGEDFFSGVAFFAFFLFAWKCFLDGEWPKLPAWLLFCLTWIILQGMWMTLNANSHYRFHDDYVTVRFLELASFPDLPGSRTRFKSPVHFYPQVGVFCLMIIVVNSTRQVREQYLRLLAACAIVFTVFAITMKLWGLEGLRHLWTFERDDSYKTVFGTFRYHGNAATFLAIGMALTIGSLLAGRESVKRGPKLFLSIGLLILLFGAALNTSRAGWLLAIYVCGAAAIVFLGGYLLKGDSVLRNRRIVISSGVAALLIGTAAFLTFWADKETKVKRLETISESVTSRYPKPLFEAMAQDTPLFGFGPGAFPMVFPKYQVFIRGHMPMHLFQNEAHQDYYQYFFDWGHVGVVPWMIVFFAPILTGVRRPSKAHPIAEPLQCMGVVALSAALIHSVFDFPLQVTSLLFFFGIIAACLTTQVRLPNSPENPAQV